MLREIIGSAMQEMGFQVTGVANGRECMGELARWVPDLVLLDVTMPEVGGLKVLAAMRTDVRLRSVPVLMLSAQGSADVVKKAVELGARDYVVKPFEAAELQKRVSLHLLDERKLLTALENLNTSDRSFFQSNDPDAFYRVYQTKIGSRPVVVTVPKALSIKAVLADPGRVAQFVTVFEKTAGGWRLLWPTVPETEGAPVSVPTAS